jgi:hypothetical protein
LRSGFGGEHGRGGHKTGGTRSTQNVATID